MTKTRGFLWARRIVAAKELPLGLILSSTGQFDTLLKIHGLGGNFPAYQAILMFFIRNANGEKKKNSPIKPHGR